MRRLLFTAACGAALAPAAAGQGPSFLRRPAAAWARELTDGRPAVRRSACFALGRIGAGALPETPELARRLRDTDAGVRAMSAEALGDVVGGLSGGGLSVWVEAGPELGKALADPDARVRAAAAYALGAFGERAADAAPALRSALHDPDPHVRRNAARALGRLGEEAGGGAVGELCGLLKDADALVRRDVVTALGTLGPPAARPAAGPLLALLKTERDGVVRRVLLEKLVGLVGPDDRSAAADLYPLLSGDDPDAARSAALVLANLGGPAAAPAVPALRQALRDGDEPAQALAAAALAGMGPAAAPAVLDLARALTGSKSTAVRRNAALALAHVGPQARDALPLLINALAPTEPRDVRMFAAEAIKCVGSPANDTAVPALLRLVEADADPQVRHHCAWCVAQRADHETTGISRVFAKVIEETAPETLGLRYEAAYHLAQHLGEKAPDRTVDVLLDLFRDPRLVGYTGTDLRVSGAGGESGGGKSETTVVRPADASTARVEGARALGWLGPKANRPEIVRALREAQGGDDPALRKAATEALRRIAQ